MTDEMRRQLGVRMESHSNSSSNNEILSELTDPSPGQTRHLQLRDVAESTLDADFWIGLAKCHVLRTNVNATFLFTESDYQSMFTTTCLDEQVSKTKGTLSSGTNITD